MNVLITEYLRINLDTEQWECRRCSHVHGSARHNYKRGLLVYNRDPREIHKPLLNPEMYERTYAPDPDWCRILEYYCSGCGVLVEAEYLPPGHPPLHDIDLDLDALKAQWKDRDEVLEPATAPDLALEKVRIARARHAHAHGHSHH
ncbi:acetone carboxylase subunit gamma [Sinimarinibacterium sp. NLF-5-8]|uniref:acetone carboxylase subunit gamma n=1 Tax=Sinimarinibacterium sp. NLF-5-8 TaxID=2698684 RepID=UPI00137BBF53|nr:acetone carboxylase subunit gamma [Sinimarinibacterium sp. NLF-5-8]QHS10311.1 acetone carboxylase subunit gamma [Sinimarinibacterium sp. NLF-5-8]